MKRKKEKVIPSLGIDMQFAQIGKFEEDFENARKKENKGTIIKLIFILGPLLLGVISSLAFSSSLLTLISFCVAVSGVIVTQVMGYLKEVKRIDNYHKSKQNQIFNQPEEKDVEQVLEDGIGNRRDFEFYTEQYRDAVEGYVPPVKTTPDLKIAKEEVPLNKEETMEQIVREMDAYCVAYKLPPINIKNNDWDCFFDTLYDTFTKKGIETNFYPIMASVERQAFSRVLLDGAKTIGIKDFIKSLKCLEIMGVLNEKELNTLQKELFAKSNDGKVVSFSDFIKQEAHKR